MDNINYNTVDLDVYYGKTPITRLARNLIIKQKVSLENIELLKKSHVFKYLLFKAARNTNDVTTLRELASLCTRLEFEQQKLWGFPQDASMHGWDQFPKCTCINKQVNDNCVIHGITVENKNNLNI